MQWKLVLNLAAKVKFWQLEGKFLNFILNHDLMKLIFSRSSSNHAILQVMSDVFNSPVYIQKTPEAACLGAAYRAKYVMYKESAIERGDTYDDYHAYIKNYCDKKHFYIQRVAEPYADSQEIYDPMLERYREIIKVMMQQQE